MSKDQIIRDIAFAMWEAEGRPDGKADEHWKRAASQIEAQVASSTGSASTKKVDALGGKAKADQQVEDGAAKKPRAKKPAVSAGSADIGAGRH